jgi:Tol biopolymer transport system component
MRRISVLLWVVTVLGAVLPCGRLDAEGFLDNLGKKLNDGAKEVGRRGSNVVRDVVEDVFEGKDKRKPAAEPNSPHADPADGSVAAAPSGTPFPDVAGGTTSPSGSQQPGGAEMKDLGLAGKYRVVAEPLGRIPATYNTALESGDGRHYLCEISTGSSRYAVMIDGRQGPEYARIGAQWNMRFSPDGERFAYAASRVDGMEVAVIDGQEGPPYKGVGRIVFSPDSRHVAYGATKKLPDGHYGSVLVVDGQEHPIPTPLLETHTLGGPCFSPDSKRIAYLSGHDLSGGPLHMVVDGQAGPEVALAMSPVFSQDSKHVAYGGQRQFKYFVIHDSQAGTEYYSISWESMSFSPDGNHLAYSAIKDDGYNLVVIDGEEGPPYDAIEREETPNNNARTRIVWSADSTRLAYVATRGQKAVVVVNGREEVVYSEILKGSLTFSPDGKRMAFMAAKGYHRWVAVVDGREGPEYTWVGPPVFSPDGKHVAYEAQKTGRNVVVVYDGQEGAQYIQAFGPTFFGPGGSQFAYVAQRPSSERFLVINGRERPELGSPGGILTFSPDGKRVAFFDNLGGGGYAVIDGRKGPSCERIDRFIFSSDSQHLAYVDRQSYGKGAVVLDGQKGPEYEWIAKNGPVFREDGSLEYLATDGGFLYRVRHIPAGI